MSSATWTIKNKCKNCYVWFECIQYILYKIFKECLQLQDEVKVLYISLYIYIFTVIVPFYFNEQWSSSIILTLHEKERVLLKRWKLVKLMVSFLSITFNIIHIILILIYVNVISNMNN
jgi:hypothetical protein